MAVRFCSFIGVLPVVRGRRAVFSTLLLTAR
jgi:hypothetical protein